MENNFNCNRDGLSIQAQLGLDSDQSQYNFTENLTRIKEGLWFYTDWQNLKSVAESDLYIVTDETRENVINKIMELDADYQKVMSRKELSKASNSELLTELDSWVDTDPDDMEFFRFDSDNYEKIETRGYSQGDYAEVIIPKTKLAEHWGLELDEMAGEATDSLKKEIGHYFWDAPFYFMLEVDGEDTLDTPDVLCELGSEYETNTSVILCAVAKQLHGMKYTDEQQQEINGFLAETFTEEYIN